MSEGRGAAGLSDPAAVRAALAAQGYLADEGLAVTVFLALDLGEPLLLEGEAGVGKTETAKALAAASGARLIRLQCHEGIDVHSALYDWDYPRQLLAVRAAESGVEQEDLFRPEFLLRRPLLEAIDDPGAVVLLIDEVDRADDEFEAFLLELLSDFQVTIPELGTIEAKTRPTVIVTSNRTRELHDALKRRFLYHWIDFPSREREAEIVRVRAPEVPEALARQVAEAVARLREMDVAKRPGVAETIDWSQALTFLGATRLEPEQAAATLGALLKDHEDLELVRARLGQVLGTE